MAEVNDEIRPTLLMVGRGEAMDAALKVALDRHGLRVVDATGEVKAAVRTIAPDVVLLVGDAAADGGRVLLDVLSADAVTNVVPVIVLGPAEKLDGRITAFRAGAVAVVPRTASADQIATRIATVAKEIAERGEARPDELGEATFDELVTMVASELRSGILSVGRQRSGAGAEPMRIVLGAGRPVADAVEEFVRKLRPLVSRAEPLTYELHASAGGPVGLLDAEPAGRGDLGILQGLRIILVDSDASRADTLSQELRARGSVVAVADPSARGIERARGLDPQVVIVDAAGIDGTGFEVVRAIRRDVRLRWAAMLVAPWAEIWPENAATPDLAELALRLAPLVMHDRELRMRATEEQKFDARLEVTGPSRMLRVLASLPGPFHIHVQSRKATVDVDVAEGLVVGAKATRAAGDELEGTRALAALLVMASARVTIERRPNPATANVMAPIEEALSRASQEAAPIPVSQPPPPMQSGAGGGALGRAAKRSPFPTASDIGRGLFDDDGDASGPVRPPASMQVRASTRIGETSSRDLRWAESEHGAGTPVHAPPHAAPHAPAPHVARAPLPATPHAARVPPPPAVVPASPPSAPVALPHGVFSGAKATGARLPAPRAPVRPPAAAASAFGDRGLIPDVTPVVPAKREDATVRVHVEDAERALSRPRTSPPSPSIEAKPSPAPSSPGHEHAPAHLPRPAGRKATLVMGALDGAGKSDEPPPRQVAFTGPLGARSPTLTLGSSDAGAAPHPPPLPAHPPPPPPPGAPRTLETISASVEAEHDPLFADGQSAMESGEHISEPPASGEGKPPEMRSGELTSPSSKPFVPEADAMREPIGAPPVPPSALIAPPSRPRIADAAARSAPPPAPDVGDLHGAIGSLAMTTPPAAPTLKASPRADPTPLGVISIPAPPSGVSATTSSLPPAPLPSAAGRTAAWVLVGLGLTSVLAVGGWAAYARRDRISTLLGLSAPELTATSLDAGVAIAEAAPDAGPSALIAVVAEGADAGPVADDAWVEPNDAFVAELEAPDAWVAPAEPDAWVAPPPTTAPPPSGEASVADLLAQAAHADAAVAEPIYRRVLALDPNEHHAAHALGEILMRRHQPADAVPLFELVTRRRPGQAGNWVDLGDARRDAGDLEGARAAWRQALERDPENADAHARLGE